MGAIVAPVLGALGGLTDGVIAATKAMIEYRKTIVETAVFGVGNLTQKPVQVVFEGLENLKVLKDFNIDFGSKYMQPFGSVAYWEQIVRKIKETNKDLGYAGALSENLAESIRSVGTTTLQLGFDDTEISNAIKSFADENTNNRLFSDDDLVNLGRMNKSLGVGFDKIITYNQQFGGSVKQSYGYVDGLLKRVDKYGLNAKQYIQTMQSNLALMNKYQFNDGIKGLEKATLNAQRYKVELGDIATIADKAMNPEGALELTAQMSALGGSFAENFGDFYSVIEKSRNGVDGLSDSLKKAFTGLATFNKEKGVFEVNTLNRTRIQAGAGYLGMSTEAGYKIAIAGQKEEEIKKRIRLSQFTNADEAVSKIAGAAEFAKGGVATIKIVGADGKTINKNVSDVTEKDLLSLNSFKDDGKDATQQLIDSNMTNVQALERNTEEIKRLFFSFEAYKTGGSIFKSVSENMLNQTKTGTGFMGGSMKLNRFSEEDGMARAAKMATADDLSKAVLMGFENLKFDGKENKELLDKIITEVFNNNQAVRNIIETTAKGETMLLEGAVGFLSNIADYTRPIVSFARKWLSPVDIFTLFDGKKLSAVQPNVTPQSNQNFIDRQQMIKEVRSSVTPIYKPMSDMTMNKHTFEGGLTIEVKGDKDLRKNIDIDADTLKGIISGKFNSKNGGLDKPTSLYLKTLNS
jgi:hypothetical protein